MGGCGNIEWFSITNITCLCLAYPSLLTLSLHLQVPSQKGTLFVKHIVDLPPTLSKEQQDAVAKAF